MGRPRVYKNRQIYQLPIEKDDLDTFKDICKREGVDMAEKIQENIKRYNKAHEKGNPCFTIDKWTEDPEFRAFQTLGEKPDMEQIDAMEDKDLIIMAKNVRRFVFALQNKVRDIDYMFDWGDKTTNEQIAKSAAK